MPTASRTSSPKPKPKREESHASRQGEAVLAQRDKAKEHSQLPHRPRGLQSNLLTLYGALALAIVAFGILAESMRHHIPSHQFQRRDGNLIDLDAFDPVELGPFPRCHEHFGEHLSTNGTWVKNSEVVTAPFPVGHPQNPQWLEKVNRYQADEHFTWRSFQASLHMLVLASLCMFTACKHSVWTFTEPIATRSETVVLQQEDAYWLPVIGSGFLLGLFLVLKYLSIDWVKELLQFCIVGSCSVGAAENFEDFCKFWRPQQKPEAASSGEEPKSAVPHVTMLKCLVGFCLAMAYVTTKHWILNNVMGLSFCLLGIRHINLSNFRTGVVLLAGLFVYDVFWVFFSKPVFGSNVMVSVAKGIEAPMKLTLPRDFGGCGEFRFSMLGLGDIAVPGLFCALLAKWDAAKMATGSSKGFTYLNIILVMYILSLITTIAVMVVFNHAQPALLYICPFLLIGSVAVAFARGEFSELLAFSVPGEADASAQSSVAGEESKKRT